MSEEAPESREAQRLHEPTAAVQPPPDEKTVESYLCVVGAGYSITARVLFRGHS